MAVAAHAEVNTKEEAVIGSYTISITKKAGRKTKVICNRESVWKKKKINLSRDHISTAESERRVRMRSGEIIRAS